VHVRSHAFVSLAAHRHVIVPDLQYLAVQSHR